MVFDVRRIEYFIITVADRIQDESELLSRFAAAGADLLAFRASRLPGGATQFILLPKDGAPVSAAAKKAGWKLDGPHPALLVHGDEEPGALSVIYQRLARAGIPVRESSGIAHVNGGYGVVLFLDPGDCERAVAALKR